MALSNNPTRTRGTEKAWRRELNRRFREFTVAVVAELERMADSSMPATNAARFDADADRLRAYMAFFQSKIDSILLGTPGAPNWQARYQLDAYRRGVARAKAALRAQGVRSELTREDFVDMPDLEGAFSARSSLDFGMTADLGAPIHQETLEFLYSRSYDSYKGWTDKLATETRRIMFEGVRDGKGIRELVRELRSRVDVTRSRAEVIARTEVIQGYQRGSINQTARVAEETGDEIGSRWITARDSRVRHLHAGWHGTVTDEAEANRRIGVSPWNCRCGVIPVIADLDTPEKKAKFKKERDELLALEDDAVAPTPPPQPRAPRVRRPKPPKTPQPTPEAFVPARTIAEAEQFVRDKNLSDRVNWKKVDLSVANDWNETIWRHQQRFPELRNNSHFLGTSQERNRLWVANKVAEVRTRLATNNPGMTSADLDRLSNRLVKKPKVGGRTWAQSWDNPEFGGVTISEKYSNKVDHLQRGLTRSMESKWHPVGTDTVKAIIDHELGHELDTLLGLSRDPEVREFWQDFKRAGSMDDLSEYGQANIAEFIAEAWSESENNPNPRAIAKRMAGIINNRYEVYKNGR